MNHKQNPYPLQKFFIVILLTAMAYRFNQQQLTELGVRAAIAKPFHPLTLTDEIAKALGW